MPRPKQTTPSRFLNMALPEPLMDKIDLHLYSEVEGRVPVGAYKAFFSNLALQYFESLQRPCTHCNATGVRGVL